MRRFRGFFIVVTVALLVHSLIVLRLPSLHVVKYLHAAELFLQGTLSGERLLDFSPLYLYLNVLVQWMKFSPSVLLWINIAASAVSSGLLYLILSRYFSSNVVLTGIAIFIVDRSLLIQVHTFEPEPLLMLFMISASYFVTAETPKTALFAGFCWGLGILTRPNFLPALLAVPFYYKGNSEGKQWIKNTALVVAPALACLGVLWLRNTAVMGYFTPHVMNPGTVFYEGNNPNSRGTSSVYPPVLHQMALQYSRMPDYNHQLYREFARRSSGQPLSVPEVNNYWTHRAINFISEHPVRALELLRTKALHFFHTYLWHDLATAYSTEQTLKRVWPLSLPFSILSASALSGLALLSSNWKRYLIFYALFFAQFVTMMAIYVSSRQRMSVLFLFIFFACGSMQYIVTNKRRWVVLAFIVLVALPLHLQTDFMREEDHLWRSIQKSNALAGEAYRLRNSGKILQAANQASQSLAVAPMLMDSRRPSNLPINTTTLRDALVSIPPVTPAQVMDRAVLFLELGLPEKAEPLFLQLQEVDYRLKRDQYQSSDLNYYIARCVLKRGQQTRAVEFLQEANRRSPGDPSVLAFLSVLTGKREYEEQLFRYFSDIDASFFLGKASMDAGNPEAAVRYFEFLTQTIPEFRKGYIYLAAALSRTERYEEGARVYRKAIGLGADPVFQEEDILRIFHELALRSPSAIDRYSYGVVLRQFGHFEKALQQQQEALKLDPSNQEIIAEMKSLQRVVETFRNKAPDNVAR